MLVGRVDGLEVVCTVEIGAAVELRAMIGEFFLDVVPRLGLDKQDMLEQVSHAGLAVAFVTRTYQIGHIHCHFGLGRIGK